MLSVVIPTCNRPAQLAECLRRLTSGSQSGQYEVIVTDDSMNDESRRLLDLDFPWARWMAGPRRGPAANRNHGAREARGEQLAFVDDDCLPGARWVESILSAFQRGAHVVEGKTICPDATDSPFQEQVQNLLGGMFWSCNLAIERQAFLDLGGFDEDFTEAGGEDMEFAWRVQRAGLKHSFEPGAVVEHPARRIDLKGLIWRLGMMRWMLLYRHKTGQAIPLERSHWAALLDATAFYACGWARLGWRFVREFPQSQWRRRLFEFVWKGATLPLVLPYLLYWELQFRRRLAE